MILRKADVGSLQQKIGLELSARPYSELLERDRRAAQAVRAWLRGHDIAFMGRAGELTPPVWIARKFRWGPHAWPVYWDDVAAMPALDCGAMAALTTEVVRMRGQAAFPMQLVLRFTERTVRHWTALWRRNGQADIRWCSGIYAYHEATGIPDARGRMRIWDPLGRFWLPVVSNPGIEGVVALRFHAEPGHEAQSCWMANEPVQSGVWYAVTGGTRPSKAAPARAFPDRWESRVQPQARG